MPITTRADGDVVTASSWNANVRDQVVSTTTSGARPAGTEGQFIVETDTDLLQVYSGAAWVPFGGYGVWTAYTPTFTQSGAVTKTVTYAKYIKIGRLVIANVQLTCTGAGTANNAIIVGAPLTAAVSGDLPVGAGRIYDASVGSVSCAVATLASTTTFRFFDSGASAVGVVMGQTGASFNAALAAGDIVDLTATYEAAA